jgi:CRISPR-associated Csx14 family protein
MTTVLIASLDDSPVVITAMFDLLNDSLKEEKKGIDQLEVFYPTNSFALVGYDDLICKSLQHKCEVNGITLDSDDVGEEDAAYDFLHKLYYSLNEHQKKGDVVYLSLAGGRKSMAALMALLAPLFSCIKGLYHILDKDEGKKGHHFWSTGQLYDLPKADQLRLLFPPHKRIKLIPIPYGEKQYPTEEFRSHLYTITDDQLDEWWERDAEQAKTVTFYRQMAKGGGQGKLISVELTKEVVKQYREMRKFDVTHAVNFAKCFDQMYFAWHLNQHSHDIYSYKGLHFHFYKRHRTAERPVFHTEPVDIKAHPEANIKRVVVSALPIEVEERTPPYPPLKEIVRKLKFPLETEKLKDFFSPEAVESESEEHILIVPLGVSPMIATQLYQLYIDKSYKVRSVILVHTQHPDVRDSVEIVCDAFKSESVPCEAIPLKGWDDIDTLEACAAYQALLEQTICNTLQQNPSCQIELTISGGRKGMAALAIFAAQRLGIRRVAHTVIHERVNDKVSKETEIEELKKLVRMNDKKKRNNRLFLRAYKEDEDAFVLFKLPVIPAQRG